MSEIPRIINMEDPAGKTVGRRRPCIDPLSAADRLQKTADDLLLACGHQRGKKGVFRFNSHEEADLWWTQNTILKK